MPRRDLPSRSTSLAATATTLVALAALAAATPGLVRGGGLRGVVPELSPAVRAVAAVVAAARDFLGGSSGDVVTITPVDRSATTGRRDADRPAPRDDQPTGPVPLAARLLDLPPPAC